MRKILTILFIMTLPLAVSAQKARTLPLLEMNMDARGAAMGGNYYGEASNMLTYSNPTSIFYMENNFNVSLSGGMFKKIKGIDGRQNFSALSASYKFMDRHSINIGMRYMGGLKVDEVDNNGVKVGTIKPRDWTVDLGYAFMINDYFSVAGQASLVQNKPANKSAYTVAFNVGGYYRNSFETGKYVLGVSGGNFGPYLDYGKGLQKGKMPIYAGLGGELGLNLSDMHMLNFSLSGRYFIWPEDAKMFTANVGAEYSFDDMVKVRAGYRYGEHDWSNFSCGAGLKLYMFELDCAYVKGVGSNKTDYGMITVSYAF